MGLEQLLAALTREGAENAAAELETGRVEAASIEAAAAERIARRRTLSLRAREAEFRTEAERAVSEARRRSERDLLHARLRLLDRIWARAAELAPAVTGSPAYQQALANDSRQALSYLGAVPAVVQCQPELLPALKAILAPSADLGIEADSAVQAGYRIRALDGSVLVDRTLEQRLAAARPALGPEALRRFEGAP